MEQIQQVYEQSKCRCGSPMIAVELKEQGINVSRPRVVRLTHNHLIQSIVRKYYRVQTTYSNHTYAVAENYLSRDFSEASREMGIRFNLY